MLDKKILWVLTVLLIASVGLRFNIAPLAWVMYVPLLLLVRNTSLKKEWLIIALLLQIGYFLQTLKIITDPLPVAMALIFSVPAAFGTFMIVWIFEKMRRRVGDLWGVILFASLMSLSEWANYHSELGSWGSLFYTQADSQAFMQFSALFGISFGSFFLYLSSAFVSAFIASSKRRSLFVPAFSFFFVFLLFYTYGVIRITQGVNSSKQMRVAAISSELKLNGDTLVSKELREKNSNTLFEKTQQAISMGAQLIAWSEGATVVTQEESVAFKERLKQISLVNGVSIVAAYIVPKDGMKKFENKYIFISKGKILDEYYKFHPVPGEGSIKGENIAKSITLNGINISGAICYDFDFPPLARSLAQKGVGLVIVPSSDWRGIDRIHAEQAMVRAIEGGYSLLRPVSGASSYAYDAYGNIRASMNFFEQSDHILMASLPTQKVWTLYSKVGDIFVVVLLLLISYISLLAWRTHKRKIATIHK